MPTSVPSEKNSSGQILKNIPRPQKIAVIVLALLAILIIIFWISQFRAQLTRPFGLDDDNNQIKATETTVDPRTTDTDHDGLMDYDEINTYQTSLYLADTDSDGISDKQEIAQGTDPNCPQGKNCNVTEDTTAATSDANQTSGANVSPTVNLATTTGSGLDENLLQGILAGGANAATLRQILISSGIDKAELDQISDEDLMKSYQETLQSQNTQ
ncbi:MAG: hypothetical protein WC523_06365 [Patescibacteria group bacterium]